MNELFITNLDVSHKKGHLFTLNNLTFKKCEIYIITGENGVGKTTLLKSILKINSDYSIGYLSSRLLGLVPYLTGRENLEIYFPNHAIAAYIKKYENISFIQELLEKKIEEASEGMRQFLSLSIFLESPFDVYLLDEPFNSISDKNCEILEMRILELSREKIVIMANPKFNLISIQSFKELKIQKSGLYVE